MRKALILSMLIVTSAACHSTQLRSGSADPLARRRAELLETIRATASRMATGEFVTPLTTAFAASGVYVNANPLSNRGPASARAWLERDTLNVRSTARWTVLRHDVSADGRDGYAYGYLDVIRPSGDTLPGRYHAYWRHNAEGTWQILAFSRGRRAPGPISESLPSWIDSPSATSARVAGADSVANLRGLMATERAFSDSAGTSVQAAFMSFAAPDAAKLERGSMFSFGRAAIGELFEGPAPGGGPLWSPEVGTVASSGDLGFTAGPVTARRPAEGQSAPPGAKYFTIWRRMPNGEWRYVVD